MSCDKANRLVGLLVLPLDHQPLLCSISKSVQISEGWINKTEIIVNCCKEHSNNHLMTTAKCFQQIKKKHYRTTFIQNKKDNCTQTKIVKTISHLWSASARPRCRLLSWGWWWGGGRRRRRRRCRRGCQLPGLWVPILKKKKRMHKYIKTILT